MLLWLLLLHSNGYCLIRLLIHSSAFNVQGFVHLVGYIYILVCVYIVNLFLFLVGGKIVFGM